MTDQRSPIYPWWYSERRQQNKYKWKIFNDQKMAARKWMQNQQKDRFRSSYYTSRTKNLRAIKESTVTEKVKKLSLTTWPYPKPEDKGP